MSSSPIIKTIVYGKTGDAGPQGPAGNPGNTGNTGSTGPTGPYGAYHLSTAINLNTITLTLSDGTSINLNSASLRGATYADKTFGLVKGSNTGPSLAISQYGPLQDVDGGTFDFKGICAYGSLRASLTGPNNEYISIDSTYWGADLPGNYDPTTISTGRALYLGTPTTVYGSGFTHINLSGENLAKGVSGAFNFQITRFGAGVDDTTYHLNAGSRILSIGPIRKNALSGLTGSIPLGGVGTTKGVFLDTNSAGTFALKTPIGIQGITGSFNKNEVASITLLIDSDNVWSFPENVYFAPDDNYMSCGKNIVGLMSYDGGETWLATVSHRGHGIDNASRQCIPGYLFGSCCYTNEDGTLECLDYTTQTACDRLFGNFNPGVPCEQGCAPDIGVCCGGNGDCIEGVSVTLCDKFGGQYWRGVTCADYSGLLNHPIGDLSPDQIRAQGRFCYDPCNPTDVSVCCRDGTCLGNYTRAQCELILGGRSLTAASCGDANCCDYTTIGGACCRCIDVDGVPSYECVPNLTPSQCRGVSGFYMGPGKQCNEVSCGCVCNAGSVSCIESPCPPGQFWSQTQCSCVDVEPVGDGICCKNGTCLADANTKSECDAQCGHWITGFNVDVINANTATRRYNVDPTRDCAICAGFRPYLELVDITSCTPAASINKDSMSVPATCCRPTLAEIIPNVNACYDLFLNNLNIPIPLSIRYSAGGPSLTNEQIRTAIFELATCPTLTDNAAFTISKHADLIFQYLVDEQKVTVAGSCPEKCCVCDADGQGSVSIRCFGKFSDTGQLSLLTVLCNNTNGCPVGSVVNIDPTEVLTCTPGPGQVGPGGGDGDGNIPPTLTDCISGYCQTQKIPSCECPISALRLLAIRNVKVYINNTDFICVPVACGDCIGYEFCEET